MMPSAHALIRAWKHPPQLQHTDRTEVILSARVPIGTLKLGEGFVCFAQATSGQHPFPYCLDVAGSFILPLHKTTGRKT